MKIKMISLLFLTSFLTVNTLIALGYGPTTKAWVVSESKIKYISHKVELKTLSKLPKKSKRTKFNETYYYVSDGEYFILKNKVYNQIIPPAGLELKKIKGELQRIIVYGHPYYYYKGIYYTHSKKRFRVSTPPVGTKFNKIHNDAQLVEIDNSKYYLHMNCIYKKRVSRNKETYELVGYVK